MLENIWLREVFDRERKEVTEGRRTLCNEELHELLPRYCWDTQIKERWARHVARTGQIEIFFNEPCMKDTTRKTYAYIIG
jgi:hypothetical protein